MRAMEAPGGHCRRQRRPVDDALSSGAVGREHGPGFMRQSACVKRVLKLIGGGLIAAMLAGPAMAQGKVEFRSMPNGQGREFEVVVPRPTPAEAPTPDAKFFPQDHQVPYEPGFIAPLTVRPRAGPIKRIGAAGWTSPPSRGYGGDQNFAVGSFSMGIGIIWE
jgi:hypothetical protein